MSKKNSSLFRKKALDEVSSPEKLNQALQITNSYGWLAVTTVAVVLGVALAWGIWGSIATEVNGQGMIINRQGILNIQVNGSGRIDNLGVEIRDTVSEGEVIATLEQPHLERKLVDERELLKEIKQDHDLFVQNAMEKLRLSRVSANEQQAKLKENLRTVNNRISFLEKKLKGRQILYRDSLIIEEKVFDVQQHLSQARVNKSDIEHQLTMVESQFLEKKNTIELDTLKNHQKVIDQRRAVNDVLQSIEQQSKVRSNYNGTIVELLAYEGELISQQQPIARINPDGDRFQAIVFASPYHGKQIQPGMEVKISPSTVPREQYGSIMATVKTVSEVPASPEGLQNILHNQDLVQLVSQNGPPIQVVVDLQHDEETGEFAWTSSEGPPHSVSTGTICTGTIAVREQAPISLVIPILKRAVGL